MRPSGWFTVATFVIAAASLMLAAAETWGVPPFNPHGDPNTGVLRVTTNPSSRGDCVQCHPGHGDSWGSTPQAKLLFTENDNRLPFFDEGDGPCHSKRPDNYPLREIDRIPDTDPHAGYFEANSGGIRRAGVNLRGRWPGEQVYSDPMVTGSGNFVSPHAYDPDMPLRSATGMGLCGNCHDPHGTPNPFDLLVAPYVGIAGHASAGPPPEYALCLSCHGSNGPGGMDFENRYIEDYYDPGLNDRSAGHQIRKNSDIALSWPAHIQEGDMLPCYDCHNPHGSRGNNGVQPNAFLISDQRPEWSGLTDTINDPVQCRTFCFGCHIPSDGIAGSQTVEGIVMNTIPDKGEFHRSTSTQSCYDCHGRDYSTSTSNNVHNPSQGEDEAPGGLESPWGQ